MVYERKSEIGKEKQKNVFLSYLNDDGSVISGFVNLIELGDFVIIKTSQNIVKIPFHRVLKIKEKIKNG